MKLGQLYERAIEVGIERDPRGRDLIVQRLAAMRRRYEEMAPEERATFDGERLTNPFGDTRIVLGERDTEFDTVLTGIHIEAAEILLAGQLRQRYPRLLVVTHHTTMFAGRALASVEDTIWPFVHSLEMAGMARPRAEELVWDFIRKMAADVAPRLANAGTYQMAQALELPVIAIHTPCDVCYQSETAAIVGQARTVGEAVDRMAAYSPELVFSARIGQPVALMTGDREAPLGRVLMREAGWRPSLEIVEEALEAGANTVILTSVPPEYTELARRYGANLISLPHDLSDVRGMRLLYDTVFAGEGIRIIPCSNYRHLPH